MTDFLNSCGQLLSELVNQCFAHAFKEYKKSPIHAAVYDILNRLVVESFHNQDVVIQRLLRLEQDQVTTLNEEDYQKHTEIHLKILTDRRVRNIEEQNIREAQIAADAAAKKDEISGTPRKRKAHVPLPIPENQPDPYKKEIGVLACVKAYSEVAQKRFVDNVYMSIQSEFVNGFRTTVSEALKTGLGLNGPDGMFLFNISYFQRCWLGD